MGAQRLDQVSGNLYQSDLDPVHICYGVACYSCGTPNSRDQSISDPSACFWDPFPHPALMREVPSLITTWIPLGGVDLRERRNRRERPGGEERGETAVWMQ